MAAAATAAPGACHNAMLIPPASNPAETPPTVTGDRDDLTAATPTVSGPAGTELLTRFFGLLRISSDRYGKAFKDLQLEILPHLDDAGTRLEITVEVRAHREGGFSAEKRRIVSENAQVLKFEQADFEH